MSRAIHKMRGAEAPVSIVGNIAGAVSTVSGTTHNMGSFDVGVSNGGKKCILAITTKDGSNHLISSVTLGGVSMTEIVTRQQSTGPDFMNGAIWAADISSKSGSQAIVVTMAGTTDDVGVSGVSVHDMKSLTPADTATNIDSGTPTIDLLSLSGPADGIVIACAASDDRTLTASWSSMTEKADLQTGGSSSDHRHTAAWDLGFRASSTETITFSGSIHTVAAAASFR